MSLLKRRIMDMVATTQRSRWFKL